MRKSYQLTRETKRNIVGSQDTRGSYTDDTAQTDVSYAYDLAQNRTSMTNNLTSTTTNYTYNTMNQMLTAGNITFTYDANGNTVSKTVSGQTTTYTWDYENKMTRIDYPNSTNNTFTTNADGVRMTANDSGGNRRFIYDGASVVGEQDAASGNFVATYDQNSRQTRGTAVSYYHFDGLGSTRQLTDGNQAVTDTVSYDAWGNVLSSSGTTVNPRKYVGRLGYYADTDNGMMLLGARYFHSLTGVFVTVDPQRHGTNWYSYVENNPVMRVDPSGLCWCIGPRDYPWICFGEDCYAGQPRCRQTWWTCWKNCMASRSSQLIVSQVIKLVLAPVGYFQKWFAHEVSGYIPKMVVDESGRVIGYEMRYVKFTVWKPVWYPKLAMVATRVSIYLWIWDATAAVGCSAACGLDRCAY